MSAKSKNNLGRSLVKNRFGGRNKQGKESFRHTSELDDGYDWARLNLRSVTEQSSLDDFLSTAELAGTEFEAEKLNVKFVTYDKQMAAEREKIIREKQEENKQLLRIPRRPQWDDTTSPDELHKRERDGFLDWRRQLAQLESVDGMSMTPFEKNIEFWRQLWRVMEKSDIVCQIVDARNPLLFRCEDLETYARELGGGKVTMVLLNKADLLTPQQRELWVQYFDNIGVRVAFWSAAEMLKQQKEANREERKEAEASDEDEDSDMDESDTSDHSDDDEEEEKEVEEELMEKETGAPDAVATVSDDKSQGDGTARLQEAASSEAVSSATENVEMAAQSKAPIQNRISAPVLNSNALLTREELLSLWRSMKVNTANDFVTVGLVGYPNVGKSSTINALMQSKKVAVSETPGRTKHFQTLFIDDALMLCDCPGLVMPSFVSSSAELTVNSILPIDQMRDCLPPITLVCNRIARPVLEHTYGVTLPRPDDAEDPDRPPTALELLTAHARMRSFMTHKGIPDYQKSARQILKDYVKGKLLFCHAPPLPGVTDSSFNEQSQLLHTQAGCTPVITTAKPSTTVDAEFFSKVQQQASSKGVLGVQGYTRKAGFVNAHTNNAQEAPSKKHHNNRKKKEKLRRVFGHLDA